MSKHTQEPWAHAPEGMIVSLAPDTQPEDAVVANIKPKDARRIVTCVNACAGMADPAAEIAELNRQRDELLAALEDIKREIILSDVDMDYIDSHFMPWINKASLAISKSKGGAL